MIAESTTIDVDKLDTTILVINPLLSGTPPPTPAPTLKKSQYIIYKIDLFIYETLQIWYYYRYLCTI